MVQRLAAQRICREARGHPDLAAVSSLSPAVVGALLWFAAVP